MPTKTRWALNPKKWFDNMSNSTQKRDRNDNTLPTVTRGLSLSTHTIHLSRSKNKAKVTPVMLSADANKHSAAILTPMTQLQLPAFSVRRDRTSLLFSSISGNRQNTYFPTHTEPTIRKHGRCEKEELSIDTKRSINQPAQTIISSSLTSENIQQNTAIKQTEMTLSNMSHHCVIDYPRRSSDPIVESTSPANSSSASSAVDDNDNDNSSASELFNDISIYNKSKQQLLRLKALSVESIADSETSFKNFPSRPIIHYHRRLINTSNINGNNTPLQGQQIFRSSSRSHSLEDIFEDSQTLSTIMKRPQSSVINDKNIEKSKFNRNAHDTYNLTIDTIDELSNCSKSPVDSFVGGSYSDDSLRPAYDEECYATLPRGSSTEQINNNTQHDLRTIVDECLRPIVDSIGKNRPTKNQHRSKRASINSDQTQLIIEDITDKLSSSLDYSIYTQHQRCC
ncbi:unnamed protein product [Adineta steineri]|uniref:Uncharacterized protein n=1 Tax=Adineta steineri TaxID=433720 RepID=A0A815QB56_9BILA|nr:unnamed protein product [Adineta steineri]